jgi:hypothetical protein
MSLRLTCVTGTSQDVMYRASASADLWRLDRSRVLHANYAGVKWHSASIPSTVTGG